jgi:excisionase family DNA binding protein
MEQNDHLLTIRQVAERLQLTPRSVRQLVHRGELVGVRLGSSDRASIRIDEEALARWLRGRSVSTGRKESS